MKMLVYTCLVMLIAACASLAEKENISAAIEASEQSTIEINEAKFGADFNSGRALPASSILTEFNMAEVDSFKTTVIGSVEKVCQVKGCWMTMRVNEKQTMHVSFKDFDFFVPSDIDGRECVIDGYAYIETISVQELRHQAQDEGKSPDEIALITEPEINLSFVADGVIVKDYNAA